MAVLFNLFALVSWLNRNGIEGDCLLRRPQSIG